MDFMAPSTVRHWPTMEVRSYGQYCPIARASEILATRWTPIIVRNLLLGCETFGEIQAGAPGIPRTLLSDRLDLLTRYGIVERRRGEHDRGWRYRLTPAGEELMTVVDALGAWGARWLEVAPPHLDAHVVVWAICRLAEPQALPDRRVVIRFDLRDGRRRRIWLILAPDAREVCIKPPGFDEDLVVTASEEWLAKWHMGKISLGTAMHEGLIDVRGPRALVRTFATLGLSRFATAEPAHAG
jgi:DNA-binding HxlR family transcriptional regulator